MLYPALMVTIGQAWTGARTRRATSVAARGERTAVLVKVVTLLARVLPLWPRVRTAVMQYAAFGFLDFAAWQAGMIWGCAAIGLSLLILEALSDSGQKRRR